MSTVLNYLEDHFAQTGEWYMLCVIMDLKTALRFSKFRRGWL